jgi:hypothetical protein
MNKIGLFIAISLVSVCSFAAKQNLGFTGDTVKAFKVTCAATATPVVASAGDSYTSLQCSALGAVAIFLGGSTVNTTTGYPICTDPALCGVSTQSVASNNLYCVVASGSQTLNCIAVVK